MTKVRLLIVEDDEVLRELLVEAMEDYGLDCISAGNGKEALSLLHSERVNFVITDIKMPIMDGLTMLKEWRKIDSDSPPILLVSGYSEIESSRDAKLVGAVGFHSKPYDVEDLHQLVMSYCNTSG
ncbi:MAG: response regulator [Bdellovibrionales bacterium]|jgi:DNA-binding NtrC family response regulator|nr:response regulator [Bdellovibrionales bacterium]MBT3524780.1 response regulator [Bdellovibrionales bacterium]MBT7670366.1 response regulator [Bdellovibrionales bacterium]MBT7767141.1 response regulator [Bdellovibrionales bacterium]